MAALTRESAIDRGDEQLTLTYSHSRPVAVSRVVDGAARDAGVESGDVILSINGEPVRVFEDLRSTVLASEGRPLNFEIDRDGAILLGWTGDNGDPDNFLAVLLGCDGRENSNRAQWCHQPFEDLIQQAKVLPTQEERQPLYEEAQVIFKEQAPWATIAHSVVYMTMRPEVEGYVVHPLGGHIFNQVGLSQ